MERKEEWEVGGFQFGSARDAELARMEQDKIGYIERRLQYDHPESVLSIYNKAIEQRIFQTPVGFQYLQSLKEFLVANGLGDQAKGIPLYQLYSYNMREETTPHTAKKRVQPSQYRVLRAKLRRSVILNIILVLLVIAMFAITLTGKTENILNYERVITDRYAGWEQELTERESVVREKERELRIAEADTPQEE